MAMAPRPTTVASVPRPLRASTLIRPPIRTLRLIRRAKPGAVREAQEEQRALADSLRGGKGQEFLEGMDAKQKETLLAMSAPLLIVGDELAEAKLMRAIYSDRQLEEVMTDFWFNHFNVFIGKGADRFLVTVYERDVIRPHVLGNFEDLLVATAKSPAMLFYLDNWQSVGPNSDLASGVPSRPMRPNGPYRRRYPGR